ncbi:MAG: metallophosphoesterase family protein [Polyangiales bacterium]
MESLRRFAVIGDVHAEDERLATALAHVREAGIDCVLAVGDVVDGEGDPNRCCRLLRDHGVLTVRGNHDRWILEARMRTLPHATMPDTLDAASRDFLASLPTTRTFDTPLGPLLLCHGLGEDDMAKIDLEADAATLASDDAIRALRETAAALVVHGHTHSRSVHEIPGLVLIDAGTLHRDDRSGIIVVDLDARVVDGLDFHPNGALVPGTRHPFGGAGQDVWGQF